MDTYNVVTCIALVFIAIHFYVLMRTIIYGITVIAQLVPFFVKHKIKTPIENNMLYFGIYFIAFYLIGFVIKYLNDFLESYNSIQI